MNENSWSKNYLEFGYSLILEHDYVCNVVNNFFIFTTLHWSAQYLRSALFSRHLEFQLVNFITYRYMLKNNFYNECWFTIYAERRFATAILWECTADQVVSQRWLQMVLLEATPGSSKWKLVQNKLLGGSR